MYIIEYYIPKEGKRSLRFKCFNKMQQRYWQLYEKGYNPTWRKEA